MLGSECDLKMYVRNLGYTFRLKIRGLNPPFVKPGDEEECRIYGGG